MNVVDPYAVLGLMPGASIEQVKARFRFLAMAVHPDRNANDFQCQERLKRINAAYEFLSDAARKADFDFHYSAPVVLVPVPTPSALMPTAPRGTRVMPFLTLVVLCVFLTGIVVTVVSLIGSSPSAATSVSPPPVAIIELPSSREDPVSPSRGDNTVLGASPSAGIPGNGVIAQASRQPMLWPDNLSEPLMTPSAPVVPPTSAPSPYAAEKWLSTNAPPSH